MNSPLLGTYLLSDHSEIDKVPTLWFKFGLQRERPGAYLHLGQCSYLESVKLDLGVAVLTLVGVEWDGILIWRRAREILCPPALSRPFISCAPFPTRCVWCVEDLAAAAVLVVVEGPAPGTAKPKPWRGKPSDLPN